jgi:malate synthase
VSREIFKAVLAEEMAALKASLPNDAFATGRFDEAIELFSTMSLASEFEEFLTLPAYQVLET